MEVGCYFFLQGISPTQGLNPHLLNWQVDSLPLNHLGYVVLKVHICLINNLCLYYFKFGKDSALGPGNLGIQEFSLCFCRADRDCPGGSDGKASVYNAGDLGLIPGLGRSPGEGNGNPLQYSCLGNPVDGGVWCRLLSMGSQRVRHD